MVIILLSISFNAVAGRSCEDAAQSSETVSLAINKAVEIDEILNNTNAKVVLIARVGQDLSNYNLKYSHVAFALKRSENKSWELFHKLNSCGTANSNLYKEGLANFFLDGMFKYDAKIFVPSNQLQDKLYDLLVSHPDSITTLHESKYNMLAWPFSIKYQNSNQWILEVLAKSLTDNNIDNRQEAQQWLKNNHYIPTTLKIGTMKRLGARIFKANIAFDDQPFNERMSGNIDTITVDSVYDFIIKKDQDGYFIEK